MKYSLILRAGMLLACAATADRAIAADPSGQDVCRLLSADAASKALHVAIVRVEPSATEQHACEYSIKGKASKAAIDHSVAVVSSLGIQPDPEQAKMLQSLGGGLGGAMLSSADADVRHPGEVPVLTVELNEGNAAANMKGVRRMLQVDASVTPIHGLGDEAFSTVQSMIFVRKGEKMLQLRFNGCACTADDVIPLARQITGAL